MITVYTDVLSLPRRRAAQHELVGVLAFRRGLLFLLLSFSRLLQPAFLQLVEIGLQAQARRCGDAHDIVVRSRRVDEHLLSNRLHVEVELDAPSIHQSRHGVHVEKRPAAAVRDRHVVHLRHVRDFLRLRVAAAVADVRLDNVDRLTIDELAQPPAVAFVLACCERDARAAPQVSQCAGVVLIQRLFESLVVVVFDFVSEHLRLHGL